MKERFCACTGDCEGPRGCSDVGVKPYYEAEDDSWYRIIGPCPVCGRDVCAPRHVCCNGEVCWVHPGRYETVLRLEIGQALE